MEYRRLGRTGLQASVVGLGSGGASKLGQAHGLGQEAVTALVRRALELGINMIDTAPTYDDSERLLGEALAGVPRDSYILGTKFWYRQRGPLKSAAELRASVEESLRQLRTDYVDLFYLHGVEPEHCDAVLEAYYPTLERLRRDGLVRYLGVTEAFNTDHDHATMQALLPGGLFDVAMIGYNVLSAAPALHVLPLAREHDVGVVIMCAIRGILLKPERIREVVREWKQGGSLAQDAVPDDEPLGWLVGPWADSLTDAAYKFAAAHPAVGCVLSGTGRVEHLENNVAAVLGTPLPAELVERAQRLFAPIGRNMSH